MWILSTGPHLCILSTGLTSAACILRAMCILSPRPHLCILLHPFTWPHLCSLHTQSGEHPFTWASPLWPTSSKRCASFTWASPTPASAGRVEVSATPRDLAEAAIWFINPVHVSVNLSNPIDPYLTQVTAAPANGLASKHHQPGLTDPAASCPFSGCVSLSQFSRVSVLMLSSTPCA